MTPLTIDPARTTGPLRDIWTFGANTCHAPLWLRDDLNHHLHLLRRDCGFRYIRAHGTIGDGMQTVGDDGSFHFDRVIAGLDRLLGHGFKPFLELSHMPARLASSDKAICKYRFRSAPPNDWAQWHALIAALMQALLARYGRDELRTWYFEVWNEPDIAFWSGTQAEYFKLYDLAARAVKEADSQFRIGGPATARTNWIDEFLAHVMAPSADFGLDMPRCDFISTHAYPSDLEFLDAADGEVKLQNSTIMRELFAVVRRKVDAAMGAGFPIICGEWNSSAGPYAFNHDDCNNAAYVAKTMHELSDICEGSLYWNASDIYEEGGFHFEPFHGGYGLLTVNDVPKSAYHAFRLLAEHAGQTIPAEWERASDGLGALASRDGQELRMLIYYYAEPDTSPAPVEVNLAGLDHVSAPLRVETVAPGAGSAYEAWVAMGRPMFANRDVLDALERASQPRVSTIPARGATLRIEPGTIVQITARLPGPGYVDGAGV